MADKGDEGEKEFESTAQKIEQMRRDGNTLVLSEIFAVAALWGTITIVLISGEFVIGRFSLLLGSIFSDAARLDFWTVPASQISRVLLNAVLLTFLLFIPALCLVIVAGVIQRAFVFAPKKVLPSPSRISPVSNAKNKLGSKGLYEFSKSTIKSTAVVGVFIYFITAELMPGSATRITDARIGISELARLHVEFATLAAVVLTLISGVDAIYQRADYFRQARMTRNEVKDEAKREDGDPALKQRRREIGFEFSKGGLDGSIRDSSVVIVNPHEYAIALSWNPSSGQAPVCMAKGVDQVARSIRKLAANHGVPIYRNPPLARSLCAELRVGDCVEPEHYRAVAAAIRYAEMLRTRRHKSAFPT